MMQKKHLSVFDVLIYSHVHPQRQVTYLSYNNQTLNNHN